MATNTITVSEDTIRALLLNLLQSDPAMFLKAANTDDAFRDVAAGLLAARAYAETEMRDEAPYPAMTVAAYLDQLGAVRGPQFESKVGRVAADLYRRANGCEPETVPHTIQHGSKPPMTIYVAGYRGAEVRFIAEAMRELGF
jgi:hypothetical protein